ncbi:SURF1 family cytochrome oxidase biogenesis protein [Rhodococcus sp. MSC1_016]|uniref:SURF1 family cytochrome oxidase biogenesis protein n=1 Tax=Rhodococcus sp. MSC1_016 TaxID=2909266 RepID=UPI00202DBDF4|nr:SURF1 family protein [Rhodococcus sp. MSC1_016]
MRRLRFLLRPGWLVLAVVVAGFAFMCFYVLAPWQLGKNTSTEHRNQLIAESVEAEPVSLESLIPGSAPNPDDEWRRVTATGSYVQNSEILVRLRSIGSEPAYEVLTPLQLTDGRAILVNRGYVRPVQGTEAPPVGPPPAGQVTLDGRIRKSEGTVAGKDPITENGLRQVYFIDAGQIGDFIGIDLLDAYVQLEPDQPGGLGTIPLPQLDAGPYLSYGLQWLAFGIMAPLGLAYFVRAELRERRKEKVAAGGTSPASAPVPAAKKTPFTRAKPADSAPRTAAEAKMADRYGKSR